jgi:uncharacterized protein (TIGR02300 family)
MANGDRTCWRARSFGTRAARTKFRVETDVTKPEWGTKRTCQSCSAHFYDLRKDPIHCPKCGATFDPEAILKSRRRAPEKVVVPVKPVKPVEIPDVEVEVEAEGGAEEADDVIEDTSELGEDDADIPETIEPDEEEGGR